MSKVNDTRGEQTVVMSCAPILSGLGRGRAQVGEDGVAAPSWDTLGLEQLPGPSLFPKPG